MTTVTSRNSSAIADSWRCLLCCKNELFKTSKEFCQHLRLFHCTKEGGSYVCTYGQNSLCQFLPLEGVCDRDYETHVIRYHLSQNISSDGSGRVKTSILSSKDIASKREKVIGSAKDDLSHENTSEVIGSTHSEETCGGAPHRNYCEVLQASEPQKCEEKWSVYHSKVNMAALLNDPRPGKRQPDFFTKTWGPDWDYLDLSDSGLPDITRKHFSKYVKSINPRLSKHKKVQADPPNTKVPIDAFPPLYTRAHDKASSDLSKVPKIFISSVFDLSAEQTFLTVFPWSQIESSSVKSDRLLQEQLSQYLDVVEVQIARQVALRSEAFFHVMTSHEDLQSRLSRALLSVTSLRDKMKSLDAQLVHCPLTSVRLSLRKQRLHTVLHKMKLMATINQTQSTVQLLLSANDYIGALDIISVSQEVLSRELNGILCFRHLGSQLTEMEHAIGSMVQQEFLSFIAKDLCRPISDESGYVDEERLTAVFTGLLRLRSTDFLRVYKEEASSTIKAAVKQTVVEYVSAADSSNPADAGSALADLMRLLNFNIWMLLMEDIFKHLLVILNRIKVVCSLMKTLTLSAAGVAADINYELHESVGDRDRNCIITEMACEKICKEIGEFTVKICELANDRCAKVVSARSKDMYMERLSSQEFMTLSSSVERFTRSCDNICGGASNSLRGVLQGYTHRFITKFHEERKTRLNLSLDNERWRLGDVPRHIQALVNHVETSRRLIVPSDLPCEGGAPFESFTVAGQKFCVVGTAVLVLKMLFEYCTYVEDMPKAAADVLTRLVDILKLFNSRSSQLVLGAGALQIVGLKTISARNLALLVRCLQLILYFLPQVRDHFRLYLAEHKGAMLRHVDSTIEEYAHHIRVVQQKLSEVADTMLESCICQWEIRPPMPSACFRMLCKQLNKFYEATAEVLAPADLEALFSKVNVTLKGKLKERLRALNITTLTGPQLGLLNADFAFFSQNISFGASLAQFTLPLTDIVGK